MRINKPKGITFGVLFLGLLGLSLISKSENPSQALAPDRCLKDPYEVIAEHEHYQVIQQIQDSHGHHHQEILVSIQNGICSRLNIELDGMDYPFAKYIDKEAAISLNIQLWKRRIELEGGQETFEKNFALFAREPAFQTSRTQKPKPPNELYMPFDKYEALKRLGVKIPVNVKPADKPSF